MYLLILGNLYLIQVKNRDFYVNLGNQQYNVTVTTAPARALIYDRTGKNMLALNKESLSAFILPKQLEEPEKLKAFLKEFFPQAHERLLKNGQKSHFMYIKRKLTPEQLDLILSRDIPDIKLLNEPSRFYPIQAAAPLIGLTDIDTIGLGGVELQYNQQLAGKPTTFFLERDARSGHFYFKRETKVAGKIGDPITLTIDGDLQFLVHEEIKDAVTKFDAKEGSAIVMDPKTGEILAMATYPGFDPNNTEQITMENTKNRIVTECYELGSVFKIFTALAALEEKVTTTDELIDCKNTKLTYIDGRRIRTVHANGTINFAQVIEESNNIGIAIVAKRLGQKIYDHYTRLGFGKKTGIPFPGEQRGFVAPPSSWSKQSIISLSYGYEVNATLLQLASAFCTIARDGVTVQPQLIMHEPMAIAHGERVYMQDTVDLIKNILEGTTLHGTAKKAGIKGYKVMSKTGTANLLVDGKYDETKNIYTCAGIVQKDDYQRVIVVFVKQAAQKNLYASTVAAPLFECVAEKTLIHDKVI